MTKYPALLIDLHYLPSLEYFVRLLPYDTIQLEAHESYQKQTYRNRCYILTSQKVDQLTIPVRKPTTHGPYQHVEIDQQQPWAAAHWRALCTAYSKAPYFHYFAEHFHTILLQKHTHLFELNHKLLSTCLQLLQLQKTITYSSRYETVPSPPLTDARSTITPQRRLTPSTHYQPQTYPQVFGQQFTPNLSIIDLLFCKGHEATTILQQSAPTPGGEKIHRHIA